MKLKTLKDLERYTHEPTRSYQNRKNTGNVVKVVRIDKLKAEAVKWVKYYDKRREDSGNLRGEWEKNWIKYFFNLTEEDVK